MNKRHYIGSYWLYDNSYNLYLGKELHLESLKDHQIKKILGQYKYSNGFFQDEKLYIINKLKQIKRERILNKILKQNKNHYKILIYSILIN